MGTRVFVAGIQHSSLRAWALGGPNTHQGEGRGLWFVSGVGGWVLLFKLFSLLLFLVVTEGGSDMYFHSAEAFRSMLMMSVEEGEGQTPFLRKRGSSERTC